MICSNIDRKTIQEFHKFMHPKTPTYVRDKSISILEGLQTYFAKYPGMAIALNDFDPKCFDIIICNDDDDYYKQRYICFEWGSGYTFGPFGNGIYKTEYKSWTSIINDLHLVYRKYHV